MFQAIHRVLVPSVQEWHFLTLRRQSLILVCLSALRFFLSSPFDLWLLGKSSFRPLRGIFALPASRMIIRRLQLPTCLCWCRGLSNLFYRYFVVSLRFAYETLSLAIGSSSIRTMCPIQCKCFCLRRAYMLRITSLSRTVVLWSLSC